MAASITGIIPAHASTAGVIPARVAGTHRTASANICKARRRATTAPASSPEKWAPVTSTGVTSLGIPAPANTY